MEKREPGQVIEYAVSGRSSCKHCQQTIAEGALRVGHETRSFHHDGFDTSWYHVACFKKVRGPSVPPSRSDKAEQKKRNTALP